MKRYFVSVLHWLSDLPSELGYGIATSVVLAVLGWLIARARQRRSPGRQIAAAAGIPDPRPPIPLVLPRAPLRFVNRERELAKLDGLLKRAAQSDVPLVAVVSGMHGVGKSAIGSHWAHLRHRQFTGGALTADFSRRRNPNGVSVSDVLGDFLRELGTSDVAMPTTFREKQRLFQRLTSDRPLLVLLDDVDQPAQAQASLPAGRGSLVVVTSAFRLEELIRDGAHPVLLDPLDSTSAQSLLVEIAGEKRFDDDASGTTAVIAACGGLPIALCVCGARLAVHPERPVSWLAERLESWQGRLETLSPPGDFSVDAVFSVAYDDLNSDTAMLYRRLGLHPGPDFSLAPVAVLIDGPLDLAASLLDSLENGYLLEGGSSERWRPHDLVRDHMRACAESDDSEETETALHRLVDWYTAAAQTADHAVVEDRLRLRPNDRVAAPYLPALLTSRDAFLWFASERDNVLAVQRTALERELYERVWQIAEALWPLCASHKRYTEWTESQRSAIEAGTQLGDPEVLARMRSQLARAYAELGDFAAASSEMKLARSAAVAAGNKELVASVIEFDGVCKLRAMNYEAALDAFAEARSGFEALGRERGVALQDYHIGWCLLKAGDDALALEPLERAEAAMGRLDDPINVGRCLVRRGEALISLGRIGEASEALLEAICVLDDAGIEFEQAEAHEGLALIADEDGDREGARSHRQNAYRLYRQLGHPRADTMLGALQAGSH